jgi:hypothetical protein
MVSFRRYKSDTAVEEKAAEESTPQVEQVEPHKETETKVEVTAEIPHAAETSESKEKTIEPTDEPSSTPVEDAAKNALRLRLQEMEDAENLNRQHIQRERAEYEAREELKKNPPSVEQITANYPIPDLAKDWLRQHPEFVSDPRANHALQRAHDIAAYAAGEAFTSGYFEHVERVLGLRPKMNGHAVSAKVMPAAAPQRPQVHSPPVSAPPTREAPSMKTGAPLRQSQVHLTAEEVEMARASGISLEEYARQKKRMLFEKANGLHRDG